MWPALFKFLSGIEFSFPFFFFFQGGQAKWGTVLISHFQYHSQNALLLWPSHHFLSFIDAYFNPTRQRSMSVHPCLYLTNGLKWLFYTSHYTTHKRCRTADPAPPEFMGWTWGAYSHRERGLDRAQIPGEQRLKRLSKAELSSCSHRENRGKTLERHCQNYLCLEGCWSLSEPRCTP